jgi:hypothetical protein
VKVIIESVLVELGLGVWFGFMWIMVGISGGGGSCECSNEPSSFIIYK